MRADFPFTTAYPMLLWERGDKRSSLCENFDEPNGRSEHSGGVWKPIAPSTHLRISALTPAISVFSSAFSPAISPLSSALAIARSALAARSSCVLGGEILMRRLAQGFGEGIRLLERKPPFIVQGAGEAEIIEENGGHRRSMGCGKLKVQRRRAASALALTK